MIAMTMTAQSRPFDGIQEKIKWAKETFALMKEVNKHSWDLIKELKKFKERVGWTFNIPSKIGIYKNVKKNNFDGNLYNIVWNEFTLTSNESLETFIEKNQDLIEDTFAYNDSLNDKNINNMTYTAFLHKIKLTITALLSAAGLTYANADTTNTESSDSSELEEFNETLLLADSTEVAEVDSTVANFNEEEEKLAQKEENEGGNPGDSVTVTLNGQDYVISQEEDALYDELMKMVENDYDFTDKDEEIIERYILSSFAAKDGKANGVMTFSSEDAKKKRAKSQVYAIVQAQQKIKTDALYGDGSELKTREDFDTFEEYMAYSTAQREVSKKQIANQVNDAPKINLDDANDDDLGLGDMDLGYDEANAELDKQLADAKVEFQKSLTQGRDKILTAAINYVATGGNPADIIDNWEEIMEEFNITPDDLVSN